MKTAVLLYLYHTDLWYEFKKLIKNNCNNYDLFLSLCEENENSEIINDCKNNFKDPIIQIVKNKGVDIGPFLKQIEILDEYKYPHFIKLHGKKSVLKEKKTGLQANWRIDLVNSLIGSEFTFNKNVGLIGRSYAGCICNKSLISSEQSSLYKQIKEILLFLNLKYEDLIFPIFPAGSIYMGKTVIFKKYFNKDFIDYFYPKLEKYVTKIEEGGSYNHAMERMIGYIIKNENLKVLDGATKSIVIYNNKSHNNKLHLTKLYDGSYVLKQNFYVRAKIKEENSKEIHIEWNHIKNHVQKYKIVSINKMHKLEDSKEFDCMFYRKFNPDLINLSPKELKDHYDKNGKKEGRVTKEDILRVFDCEFYKKYYNLNIDDKNVFNRFVDKGIHEGRIYNKSIVEENFDYGFYQSYNFVFDKKIFNQFTALNDFKINKKKCNNNLEYKNNIDKKSKSVCFLKFSKSNYKDIYFLKNNIENIKDSFDKIILINNSKIQIDINNKKIKCIKTDVRPEKFIKDFETKEFDHICFFNNDENILIKSIENLVEKYLRSSADVYSISDCYLGENYSIDCSFLLFKKELSNEILNFNFENKYLITKHLIKNQIKFGSFFEMNKERELFWTNLFIDIFNYPEILIKNSSPCFKRKNIGYLLKSIPEGYRKQKGETKINSWFNFSSNINKEKIKNKFNINIDNLRFCLVFHCTDLNQLENYRKEIEKLKEKINVDIYITTNSISKKENGVFYFKNKGMDIGPFIKVIGKLINQKKNYDFLIKIHVKNINCFRKLCFSNIIDNIYEHVLLLHKSESVISGPKFYSIKMDEINKTTISDIIRRNNISIKNIEKNFFAGTMFITKYNEFINFFKNIDIGLEYKLLENGSIDNFEATNTHAWERILTNIIPNYYKTKNKSI